MLIRNSKKGQGTDEIWSGGTRNGSDRQYEQHSSRNASTGDSRREGSRQECSWKDCCLEFRI